MNVFSIITFILLILSALTVVTVRHENRLEFVELQALELQRNQLQTRWSRLMLEKATWEMQHSIAEDAGNRLGMAAPTAEKIVTVQLRNE